MSDETPLEDRTEEPSSKRRQQFKDEGRLAKSQELVSAMMLMGSGGVLMLMSYFSGPWIVRLADFWMNLDHAESWILAPQALLENLGHLFFFLLAPVFIILMIVGAGAHLMQTGPNLAWKALEPKPSKLNPVSGLKRLFASKDTYFNLVKTVGKVAFIGVVATVTVLVDGSEWLTLVGYPAIESGVFIHRLSAWTLFSSGVAMLVIGGLDFAWQHHRTFQQMKMTKEEAKKEYKENEGDPLFKGMRKQKHREIMSMNRLLDEVPKADVIINNPTHISVAVRYSSTDGTPIVVAKGADEIATKIRQIAKENNVPMVTNIPLARALHKQVKVGDHISEEFFKAVAEVLVFVWKHHGRKSFHTR